MSKNSEKKKRKRERKRQRLLQQKVDDANASRQSNIRGSENGSTPSTRVGRNAITSSCPIAPVSGEEVSSHARSEATKSSFGSSASRRRTLSSTTFVYPKDQNRTLKSFDFRNGLTGTGALAMARDDENTKSSLIVTNGMNVPFERVHVRTNQSLHDILYPNHNPKGEECQDFTQRNGNSTGDTLPIVPQAMLKDDTLVGSGPRLRTASDGGESSSSDTAHRSLYLSGVSVEEAVQDKLGLRPRLNSTDGELNLPQRGLCDERKVYEHFRWKQRNVHKTTPVGFSNLGNTCFLNSTLQCLAYCPPFSQSIMAMPLNVSSGKANTKNQGKRFSLMLGTLFRKVHNVDSNRGNSSKQSYGNGLNRSVSPSAIVGAISTLGSCGSRNGYKFRPGRQEDAHEFLVHLLDSMHNGELREAGINSNKSGWRDRLPVPRLDETTFIHRIFGGYLRSQVRCTSCGYRSNTYDPFLDLSLEISRKSCQSVKNAFQEFTRKETLDNANRYKCSGCKKKVCATKQLTVFRPPLSLCIQLKRFAFGGSFGVDAFGGGQLSGKKISKPVQFLADMQLPLSDGRSCGYSLTGIVIHVGGSASSGHYTAYVKRPTKTGEGRWYNIDDCMVTKVTEEEVLRQRDAYILIYSRKEVKMELPTPPLRGSMTAEEAKELGRSRAKARSDSVTESLGGKKYPGCPLATSILKQSPTISEVASLPSERVFNNKKTETGDRDNTDSGSSSSDESTTPEKNSKKEAVQIPYNGHGPFSPEKSESMSTLLGENATESESIGSRIVESMKDRKNSKSCEKISAKNGGSLGTKREKGVTRIMRITSDRGVNGRVEILMGPRYKRKSWKPKSIEERREEGFDLLGNLSVAKWDTDDEVDTSNTSEMNQAHQKFRNSVTSEMQRKEKELKRKMFPDRHDALLDQGKTKRIKQKIDPTVASSNFEQNRFQSIQAKSNAGAKGNVNFQNDQDRSKSRKNMSGLGRRHS